MRFLMMLLASAVLMAQPALAGPAEVDEQADTEAGDQPVYGDTVVVSASKTEEEVKNAPVAVTVIRTEDLETTPTDNYGDLLRKVPGLNVSQMSARDINLTSRASTNSLATSQLALLDGRTLYQDFFGFVAWDFLPVAFDELKQIEVIRGPGSAVWGANALNGVINIITKRPAEMQGTAARVAAGERGTFEAYARHAGVSGKLGYKVSASYFTQDAWERDDMLPDGTPLPSFENQGTDQPKLDLRFDYDSSPGERWTFSGGFAKTSGIIHTGVGPFDIDNSTYLGYGKVEYNRDGWLVRGFVNALDGDGLNLLNGINFIFKNQTYDVEVNHRTALGDKNVIVWGGTVRHNSFDLSIAPRGDNRDEVGFFVQDDILLSDLIKLNLGVRADWFDTIGWTFSPRTAVLLRPHPDHTLRASYNRAYLSPSLVNNYLDTILPLATIDLPTGPFAVLAQAVGNEDLDEETLDAFEVGWTGIFQQRATVSVSAYYNNTQDSIDFYVAGLYSPMNPPPGWPLPPVFVPPGIPSLFSYRNAGKVINKGIEMAVDFDLAGGWTAFANYSYQADPKIQAEFEGQINIPPKNRFNLGANFEHGMFQGSLAYNWTDEAYWADVLDITGYTESYFTINASLGVRLLEDMLLLQVKGTNLTNEYVKQHLFGDIIGRKVVGEARVKF